MKFDHVAIQTDDIAESVKWYTNHFDCEILYHDETWAMLNVCGMQLALVMPNQHPPHIAFCISEETARAEYSNKKFKLHRDGTKSFYQRDNQNNIIEIIVRPND